MSIAVSLLVAVLMAGLASWVVINFDRRFKETIATQQFVLISERAQDIDETIQRIQKATIAKARDLSRLMPSRLEPRTCTVRIACSPICA